MTDTVTTAILDALVLVTDPMRLLVMALGVLLGLVLGIIPGVGGLAGMALLLPFTYAMDPYSAFAMLLGMSAVIGTADTIPAVLFGVPGTGGAQATVMDGNPLAKKGEAGRALSAAYTSSVIGGLFGALLLALVIPVLRPIVLLIGTPELLAMSLLGIAMVSVLSGNAPLRGIVAACLGVMLSMVGSDPQTGSMRWTFNSFYLWDGIPILPVVLGFFALPELADLAIRRQAITSHGTVNASAGMIAGFRDAIRNWWLVIRCGSIGAGLGALPGLGAAVVDWLAYGHAIQTEKGAKETFGKGDIRGVIAPESANNAITAGSLVPTIAFGVPGSASMAVLLSVFLIHGLVPGPEMLNDNLDITYSMVWSVAIANILGAGICFAFSNQLAKIALLRYTLILPPVMVLVYVGSFQGSRDWGDLIALLVFAVFGWVMKQLKWPRPPLILGFVLGALIERYLFISHARYGFEWMLRPFVLVVLILGAYIVLRPLYSHLRTAVRRYAKRGQVNLHFQLTDLFYATMIGIVGWMTYQAWWWPEGARQGPLVIGIASLGLLVMGLVGQLSNRALGISEDDDDEGPQSIHMDSATDYGSITPWEITKRGLIFFGYLVFFMGSVALVGFILTIPIFVFVFLWMEGGENWKVFLIQSLLIVAVVLGVFDRALNIPWPSTVLGTWLPALTIIPGV